MRTVHYWCQAALAVSLVGIVGLGMAEEKDKPKSIKVIMKTIHTAPDDEEPLVKKFTAGKTSDEETKTVIAAYEDLAKNKPPKGDEELWQRKTTAILAAAKDVAAKKEGAPAVFKKAISCAACHQQYHPKP
jgi:hypothetical protein